MLIDGCYLKCVSTNIEEIYQFVKLLATMELMEKGVCMCFACMHTGSAAKSSTKHLW